MATPFPGMDPEYLKNLQAMMAAMGPSVADKDAAKWQGLLAAGLGLMGARKGQELAAVGNAGLLGLDARNRSLAQATAEKGAGLNQALNAQQLQGAMQAQADDAGYRKAMQDRYTPSASQPAPFGAQGSAPAASFGPAVAPSAASDGARLSTSKLSDYEQAIQQAQYLEAKGVAPKYVEAAYAKAEKLRPKIKETRAVVDPQTGQRVLANIYEDGRIEIQKGAAPDMEKAHFLDVGNKIGAVDPFTGKPIQGGGMFNKAVSPDAQLSANTTMRGQNMTDARSREANANAAAAGNIVETADGFVRVGKDNTVTPIVSGGGTQLQPKPTGAVQQQIASNAVTMGKIDAAMGLVDKYPNAFGLKNMAGDAVMQRVDPSGVKARAMIADIAGQKIHDRSGAAVTVGESERLKPYVPNATDTPATIKEKLSLFKKEYVAIQSELKGGKLLSEIGGSSKVVKWSDLP